MTVALFFFRLAEAGGAERMICWLAGALVERGFRVILVSWDEPGAKPFFPLHSAVIWKKMGFHSGLFDKFRRTRELARALRNNGANVLLGFVISNDKTVYAAAKLSGVKLIVAERNAPTMYWLRYSRLQRWFSFGLMHLADRITVQMPSFPESYPVSLRRRIEVIPNSVLAACQIARPDMANTAGRFVLLAVTRLDSVQKRIDCLIRAFARIASTYPEWDLQIIGDGPEDATLRRIVTELGLSGRVSIEPARSDVSDVYVHAHLFVIPSLWEGFPNALAEALSHGLPAVGFADAAGVVDLIGDDAGWLARELDDDASLAGALELAIADDPERVQRGSKGIQKMGAYDPQIQFDRWVALLNDVAGDAAR